jgi:Bacterial Ig-like domain (group 3)
VSTKGKTTPTGSVQFYADGLAVGAPAALNATGQASSQIPTLSRGIHTITAQYLGSATFAGSTGQSGQYVQ